MKNEEIFFSDKSQIGATHTPIENTHVKFSRGAKVDEIRDIKDIAKALREYVKKKYPNCKFSVSIQRYSGGQSLYVSLQEADFNPLTDESYWSVSKSGNKSFDVNQYHIEDSKQLTPEAISVLKDVRNFYNQFNYNHSNPSTDYFNVRFYETITIGSWDKGFVQVGKKSKAPRTPKPTPEKSGEEPKYLVGAKIIYKTSKGSESGTILGSNFIASRESFLYKVENPRGGVYNIWESNIVGAMPTPEKEKVFSDEDKELFSSWISQERPILQEMETKNIYTVKRIEKKEFVIENLLSNDLISFTPENYYEDFFKKFSFDYPSDSYSKKLKYIWVWWSENSDLDTGMYFSWDSFQDKLKTLKISSDGTYDKTKITVLWENNRVLVDRLDIGTSSEDFDPNREFVGDYLYKQTVAYFYSNFDNRKVDVLWSDVEKTPELPTPERPKPKFKEGDIVKYIDDNGKRYKIQFNSYQKDVWVAQLEQIDGTEVVGASEQEIELANDENPETKFKVGDVFRRNMDNEVPPNTTIIYTILSIGQDKTQYRIDYFDKFTNRLSSKSNEKLNEEVLDKWWIPYETANVEKSELEQAIDELKDSNDALWQMYIEEGSTYDLQKETRIICNDNSIAINEFSADLNFNSEKFLSDYFEKAVKPISYDNTELSKEEFDKIVNSKAFIDWFGDFKRHLFSDDPALFSKVLKLSEDEKGIKNPSPLIVYHGTWNKSHFSRFKFNKFPIIYFATNRSYAEWFAKIGTGIIYECFLDIKYLCDFRDLGLTPITWNDLSVYLKNSYGIILPENNSQKVQPAWAWIRFDAPQFVLINAIKESGFTGIAHIENNPQDKLANGEDNTTTAYMIFSPEQAKLVRYVSSSSAFTDIFFMKKGGKISKSALLEKIKSLRV